MTVLNAIILGLVQGIAEFLPISSSGHLSILNNLFKMTTTEDGHLFFDVLLHLGTLFSVCVVYWQDIVQMFYEVLGFINIGPLGGERRERYPAARLFLMIVVGTLVSDAPLAEADGLRVPSLEKALIDGLCRNRGERKSVQLEFQKALDAYPVNLNRLHRYAARRGATEELSSCLSAIDVERSEMFTRIQRYFSGIPVARAWVFGSFARGEETEASDLDLLVDYLPESRVSLLDIIRQRLDLEKIAGRAVDLVENGNLRPFAAESAERDKYLIYERKTERRSPA